MSFRYTGIHDGRAVSGEVTDGRITGNPHVVIRAQAWIEGGMPVSLGPYSGEATLHDERLARAMLASMLDNWTFDPPMPVEAVPADAVA